LFKRGADSNVLAALLQEESHDKSLSTGPESGTGVAVGMKSYLRTSPFSVPGQEYFFQPAFWTLDLCLSLFGNLSADRWKEILIYLFLKPENSESAI
jgi:hypothetical protein